MIISYDNLPLLVDNNNYPLSYNTGMYLQPVQPLLQILLISLSKFRVNLTFLYLSHCPAQIRSHFAN
jgi:hypothetical protein